MALTLLFFIEFVLLGIHNVVAFSCDDYAEASASLSFCRETACSECCAGHVFPEYCMEVHYTSKGYCRQTGGFPEKKCTVVTGIVDWHNNWCQTIACDFAMEQCVESGKSNCDEILKQEILNIFSDYCRTCPVDESESTTAPPKPTTTAPPKPTTTAPPKPTTTAPPKPTTTAPPKPTTTEGPEDIGGCWAPKSWSDNTCVKCAAPQTNQCPANGWTTCSPSKKACEMTSGGGGACSSECPSNTLHIDRPTFKGPSCYNSEFGSQFGRTWAPSGKTRFERYITSPTEFFKMVQTTSDNLPWLQKTWKLKGCDAAAAAYENVVCAIEILEAMKKKFEALPSGSPGYSINNFANTGDDQTDRRELAAFFSHQFKETARLQVWEETPNPNYAECTHAQYPCGLGGTQRYYHGRGPIQISWNYNYGAFSEWFYDDKMVLLDDPDKVDPEGPMGYIAKFWFWMTAREFSSGAPVAGNLRTRDAIIHWTTGKLNSMYNDGKDYDKVAGLGLSTNVINGGIECPSGSGSPLWRVMYYLTAAARIGVDIPDMNNEAACRADKYCNGLFSGCSASAKDISDFIVGATCEPKENNCGPAYVDGWTGELCRAR